MRSRRAISSSRSAALGPALTIAARRARARPRARRREHREVPRVAAVGRIEPHDRARSRSPVTDRAHRSTRGRRSRRRCRTGASNALPSSRARNASATSVAVRTRGRRRGHLELARAVAADGVDHAGERGAGERAGVDVGSRAARCRACVRPARRAASGRRARASSAPSTWPSRRAALAARALAEERNHRAVGDLHRPHRDPAEPADAGADGPQVLFLVVLVSVVTGGRRSVAVGGGVDDGGGGRFAAGRGGPRRTGDRARSSATARARSPVRRGPPRPAANRPPPRVSSGRGDAPIRSAWRRSYRRVPGPLDTRGGGRFAAGRGGPWRTGDRARIVALDRAPPRVGTRCHVDHRLDRGGRQRLLRTARRDPAGRPRRARGRGRGRAPLERARPRRRAPRPPGLRGRDRPLAPARGDAMVARYGAHDGVVPTARERSPSATRSERRPMSCPSSARSWWATS